MPPGHYTTVRGRYIAAGNIGIAARHIGAGFIGQKHRHGAVLMLSASFGPSVYFRLASIAATIADSRQRRQRREIKTPSGKIPSAMYR
jgi:hypothetical protein